MKIVNTRDVPAEAWTTPKGKFSVSCQEISVALGRQPASMHLDERHPFDVELTHVPPGKASYPYHSHSAQWEFYIIVAGRGQVRHSGGLDAITAGDNFLFKPGEPHQLINNAAEGDLVFYVIADNPIGESCHYPDSDKWLVRSPERRLIRQKETLDYLDGEE